MNLGAGAQPLNLGGLAGLLQILVVVIAVVVLLATRKKGT